MNPGPTENQSFYPRENKDIAMVYVGEGKSIDNIPSRDLTYREVMFYGGRFYLRQTGLYIEPEFIALDAG